MRREDCQEVAAPHSSCEPGERPFRTPWSEGGAALWMGSWNHAKDTVPLSVSPRNDPVVRGTAIFPSVRNRMH